MKSKAVHDPFEAILANKNFVLLDGGLATELEHRGLNLDDPLWSGKALLENPDVIGSIHKEYLEAGSDIVTTATYQATYEGFAKRGCSENEYSELLRLSIAIAKKSCREFGKGLTAASIGCYGAHLVDGSEYRGNYGLSKRELIDYHRKKLEILTAANPDIIAFETIPCLIEAEAILELLLEFPDSASWLTFSCRNENEISNGESFSECISAVSESPQIIATGVNCTPPQYITRLLQSVKQERNQRLIVYPNSGEIWNDGQRCWDHNPDKRPVEEYAREWHKLGANIIGGCCRTTPSNIQAMKNVLDK